MKKKGRKNWRRSKQKPINYIPPADGWAWKPKDGDIPEPKMKGGRKSKRVNPIVYSPDFYSSQEWLRLRMKVFEKYRAECVVCGRNRKEHGVVMHVDHIKPRSRYPELALELDNMQVLCEECNIGKSNKYTTDWR